MINTCEASILNHRCQIYSSERAFFGFTRDKDSLIRNKIRSGLISPKLLDRVIKEIRVPYSVLQKLYSNRHYSNNERLYLV